jgi:hypothetical protein
MPMEIVWEKTSDGSELGDHFLVFAEVGFSMLDIYTRRFELPGADLQRFVDEVNRRDEVGTLMPAAPISAIPRRAIRDSSDPGLVARFVAEFFAGVQEHGLAAPTLCINFATPSLGKHAREGLRAALEVLAVRPFPGIGRVRVFDPI